MKTDLWGGRNGRSEFECTSQEIRDDTVRSDGRNEFIFTEAACICGALRRVRSER